MTDVHLFADGGGWVVSLDGHEQRFEARPDAFATARDLARAHLPSRIVASPPTGGGSVPAVMALPRSEEDGERVDWRQLRGPEAFGRSLLLAPGSPVPAPWATCERVRIGSGDLDDPQMLARVRRAFLDRTAMVYELDGSVTESSDDIADGEPWRRDPHFELVGEAVRHLVFVNSVDARVPDRPNWPWRTRALSAGASAGSTADVELADGRAAWCDGGPVRFWREGEHGAPVVSRIALERGALTPLHALEPTAELAPDQLAAVTDRGGSARIIAPAGSGKTRVLTERARHLVRCGIPVDALCLVAFNKRAQLEMAERTTDLPGLQIQTLNALALAVVNGGRGFRSRGPRVTTIDEVAVRDLVATLVTFPRRANTDPAAAWLDALSAVRLGLRDPTQVEDEFNGEVDGFAEMFPLYRETLRSRRQVDFDEQVYLAIQTLLTDPEARMAARRTCRLLLIDEFQDLTPAHLLLIRMLAGPDHDVFGVGDDDQTIYGYSGASPDWLIHFDSYFEGARHHALEVNYRCPEAVVRAARNVLSHNEWRVPKAIHAGPAARAGDDALTVVVSADPVRATAMHVRHLVDDGVTPTDIVVLTRVNALLAPVQAALLSEGIGVDNREGTGFVQRTGVAAALSWLRIATGAGLRPADVQRAARRPGRGLSPKVIEWMAEQTDEAGLRRLADRINDRDGEKVLGFCTDVERIRRLAASSTTAQLLTFVRGDIGLDKAMLTLDAAHRGRNSTAHSDDLRAIIALGRLHPEPTTFDAWLGPILASGRDADGVQLSTVHRVKGLEWPHVVVHDATQGVFPHRLSTDIEEERRVFHVALTRCRESVVITAEAGEASIFLAELAAPAPALPTARAPAKQEPPEAPARPRRSTDVGAVVGLSLGWGGYDCEVVEVRPDGALLRAGAARLSVAFGSIVSIEGQRRTLVAPPSGAGPKRAGGSQTAGPAENPDLFEALRAWRRERMKGDGVPAYVVAADRTLREISSLVPRSLDALLSVHGMGPTKLERYGDEILAVVDETRPPG